jgi:hypothetical protein
MLRVRANREPRAEKAAARWPGLSSYAIAAFLIKFAKHMALLASFMIVGHATGRATIGEFGIFFTVATSALIYSAGRSLERRLPTPTRLPLSEP